MGGARHAPCLPRRVAQTVDGLVVYQKAMAAAHDLRQLLDAPAFQHDRDLKGQLNRASIRVVSDIAEGFEQKTDRHFARYLYDSKGGTGEIQTQLAIAARRNCISEKRCGPRQPTIRGGWTNAGWPDTATHTG